MLVWDLATGFVATIDMATMHYLSITYCNNPGSSQPRPQALFSKSLGTRLGSSCPNHERSGSLDSTTSCLKNAGPRAAITRQDSLYHVHMYTPFLAFLPSEDFDNSCYTSVHLTTKYSSTRFSTMHVHNGRQCCQTGRTCSHIRIVRWCSCFHGTYCNTMITVHNPLSHGDVCIHSR